MATNTENLGLYMADSAVDADDYFDIDKMLNENWQKIDERAALTPVLGISPPTTETVGVVGQFYLDTEAKTLYQCVAAADGLYEWEPVVDEPVGTVKLSARIDLGDNWLLCNGEEFNGSEYSELSALPPYGHDLQNNESYIYQSQYDVSSQTIAWQKAYHNLGGFDILLGTWSDGTTKKIYVAHRQTGRSGPLTIKEIYSTTTGSAILNALGATYDGDDWGVIGQYEVGAMSRSYFLYRCPDLDAGSWAGVSISGITQWEAVSGDNAPNNSVLTSGNGYIVLASKNFGSDTGSYSGYIYYKYKLAGSNPWTRIRVPSAVNGSNITSCFFDTQTGVWYLVGSGGIYYCTTAEPNAWIKTSGPTNGTLLFLDNKIISFTVVSTPTITIQSKNVITDTSWTTVTITPPTSISKTRASLIFDGTHWYIVYGGYSENPVILESETLSNTFSEISVSKWISNDNYQGLNYSDKFGPILNAWFNSEQKRHVMIFARDTQAPLLKTLTCGNVLPSISSANVYTYIKAKED